MTNVWDDDTQFGYQPPSALDDIFSEEPVDLQTFIKDRKFLGLTNIDLSPVQAEAVSSIERVYYPDLYQIMGAEWKSEYWSQNLPMKNLFTLQWGKGCKVGTMPIYDARTGDWVPLSDWKGGHVAGVDDSGTVGIYAASESWVSGRGECFRVTTTNGLVEEVYAGHRYLVRGKIDQRDGRVLRKYYSDWKQLRQMTVGDYIAVPNTLPEPTEPVEMHPDVVELFGLLMGDGCLPHDLKKRYSVGLTVNNKDVSITARYTQIVKALGGIVVARSNENRTNLYAVGPSRKRGGNPIINLLRKFGMEGMNASDKRIPDEIFRLPSEQVALFLSRLIDTDGHIYSGIAGRVPEVGYTTASHELAVGVQRLLLRLGCRAQIQNKKVKYDGEIRTYFCVRMRDRTNVENFCRQISTLSKEEARARALMACEEGNGKTRARQGDLAWEKIVSIEPIGEMDYWDLEVPGVQNYVSNGTLNHNSGKDAIARFSSLRVAYLLLCLKNPQDYFGMPDFDSIHLLNIAANSGQANQAFFTPMREAVKRGWFKDFAEPKQGLIQYAKNIVAISGHSDAEGQEGLNIMLGVADEIDAFKAKDEMVGVGKRSREASTSAESILKMLHGSASTRFPQTYKRVVISYPRYLGSTIQQQTTEGLASIKKYGEKSIHYVSGPLATWEVNPRINGKEDFQEDYDKDPDEAASMYECKPTRAIDPYFRNPIIFRQAMDREDQPLVVDYRVTDTISKTTGRTVRGWETVFTFAPDFQPVAGARYAMHGDLAINGDRAGIALSHIERWEERVDIIEAEDGEHIKVESTVPVVRNDFTISFEADVAAKDEERGENLPREIQIRWARMLAFELIKRGFYIGSFTFDGFQSVDTIQILLSHGIESGRVSTDRDPDIWKTVKDVASEARLRMPFNQLLLNELESLSRMDKKVDHPPGGSKDAADAFACSIVGAIALGGEEDPDHEVAEVGMGFFEVGDAIAPLVGMDELSFGQGYLGLPIGMKGMSFSGD